MEKGEIRTLLANIRKQHGADQHWKDSIRNWQNMQIQLYCLMSDLCDQSIELIARHSLYFEIVPRRCCWYAHISQATEITGNDHIVNQFSDVITLRYDCCHVPCSAAIEHALSIQIRCNHIKIPINHVVLCRQAMCDIVWSSPAYANQNKLPFNGNIIHICNYYCDETYSTWTWKHITCVMIDYKQQIERVRVEQI